MLHEQEEKIKTGLKKFQSEVETLIFKFERENDVKLIEFNIKEDPHGLGRRLTSIVRGVNAQEKDNDFGINTMLREYK